MPTYEYQCDFCKHRFEIFQLITANPLRKCPKCGKKKVKRLLGAGGGILFKGSGFYQTDYRSKSYREGAKKQDSASKDSAAGSGSKGPEKKEKDSPKKDSQGEK